MYNTARCTFHHLLRYFFSLSISLSSTQATQAKDDVEVDQVGSSAHQMFDIEKEIMRISPKMKHTKTLKRQPG